MPDRVGLAGLTAGIAASLVLSGCASLDSFAGRMNTYNNEAERSQDQSIMLNVLRAADYRPLSFTDFQTVSATVTPSATLSLAGPLAQNGSLTPTTVSPTLGLTGGPTIQAAYINTQDFYRGILGSVPITTIDLLIQRRIPSTVLFNLLFSRIIVRQIPNSEADGDGKLEGPAEVFTAVNDLGGRGEKLGAFQDLVEALVNEGLTTGPGKSEDATFGAPVTDLDLAGSDLIAKAAGAGLKVREADWCEISASEGKALQRERRFDLAGVEANIKTDCQTIEDAAKHPEEPKKASDAARKRIAVALAAADAPLVYRLVKPGAPADPHFCLASPRSWDGLTHVHSGICQVDASTSPTPPGGGAYKVRIAGGGRSDVGRLCAALNEVAKSGENLNCEASGWIANGLEVDLEPRSTFGVIYYLGEIERRERGSGPNVFVKIGDPMAAIPQGRCTAANQPLSSDPGGYACRTLFYLRKSNGSTRDYLAVSYAGERYAAPDREAEGGKTNEVLDIVSELVALNRSAKDAPTSSLFNVVGVH